MAGIDAEFTAHVETGVTTLCRCWSISRSDGTRFGFTDHDENLAFDGLVFKADTGLSALALQQSTGLSVDNTEAIGAVSDASIREDDIQAGRFDGAEVQAWMVNWADVSVRWLQFRGSIGEIRRGSGAFHAELRGLTEALNRPLGRIFQKPCTAVLGDRGCGMDLGEQGFSQELEVETVDESRRFHWTDFDTFEPGWFARGRLLVLSGEAKGLWASIKRDTYEAPTRKIEVWEAIRQTVRPGDRVRLEPGCDKRFETCRFKFNNLINFQGFPDIPSEDWVMSVPRQNGTNAGGSLR